MKTLYRKHGRAARYENGQLLLVRECGEATLDDDLFRAAPLLHDCEQEWLAGDEVAAAAAAIASAVPAPVRIERLIVTHGVSEQECGGTRWSEENRRTHVALVHGRNRALLDRGDFETGEVARVALLLARAGDEREAPPMLRLAPAVTAAVIPALVGVVPPNVTLVQSGGGRDGVGDVILEQPVVEPPWPNWYRPSYRVRPMRLPLNLRLECDVREIDRQRPEAVAVLAPVSGLVLRVLVADGRDVYPCSVRVVRIDAVAEQRAWYPYGGGTFGAEAML